MSSAHTRPASRPALPNRRRFVGLLGATVLAPGLAPAASAPTAALQKLAPSEGPLATTPLSIQAPRPDGFTAVWGVRRLARGRIEWESAEGTSGSSAGDAFGFAPQGDRVLRVRLEGLRPGGVYRVRAVSTDGATGQEEPGPWKTCRTLDPSAKHTRFVVWNDTHLQQTTLERLHAVTPPADFLVWNGDTCNDWTREDLLVPALLNPGGRDITEGRPLHVVWGNHDVRGPWAFRMPDCVATPSGRPFHAFRSGPLAAVCLHTGEDKPDSHPSFGGRVAFDALRAEQAAWLDTVLQRPEFRRAPYRMVFCHIPLRLRTEREPDYSKGGFDHFSARSRAAWHAALVRWRAQVVVSGHTHHADWLPATREFPYAQLIGGGPQPAGATWMEGQAGPEELRITMRNLDGTTLHDVAFPPLARLRRGV